MAQVDLVQRYRHLRVVSSEVQTAALGQVPWTAVIEFGRRVGAVRKGELVLEWEDELKLVQDLAIHTAKNQRSRAIDRYARVAPYPADSDQAHMLKALQDARFTIFQIKERHPVAGVMISDLFREQRFHLMDMGIAMSAGIDDLFVGRLMEIDGFVMSCLSFLPLRKEQIEQVALRLPRRKSGPEFDQFQDPRCAIGIYRAAIEHGWMQLCVSLDVAGGALTEQQEAA
jgi:hypothetical protein